MSKITFDTNDRVFRVPISKYAELVNGLDQVALQYNRAKTNPQKIDAWVKAISLLNGHLRDYIKNRISDPYWKGEALGTPSPQGRDCMQQLRKWFRRLPLLAQFPSATLQTRRWSVGG